MRTRLNCRMVPARSSYTMHSSSSSILSALETLPFLCGLKMLSNYSSGPCAIFWASLCSSIDVEPLAELGLFKARAVN